MRISLRLSRFGLSAQTLIPGLYAWAVTVAGPAFGRGASLVAKAPACAAVAILVGGAAAEHRWGTRLRPAFTWGFVLTCAVTWGVAPAILTAMRADPVRAGAGVLGWGLFAFASAVPATRAFAPSVVADDMKLTARRPLAGGDAIAMGAACVLAATLQLVGWRAVGVERELLVRFVSLAAGIAIVGGAAEAIIARHSVRAAAASRARLRRAVWPALALAVLLVAGLILFRAG
jgi:hypothetical protein